MNDLYKENLSNSSPNINFLKYRDGCKEENVEENKKLISNYDFDFDHITLQNAIAEGKISDTYLLLSEFKNFYSKFEFKPTDNSVSSTFSILAIIGQRNPNLKELNKACFSALNCLFLSRINPSILVQGNILNILHQYLAQPKIDDIIPSLEVIKYLAKTNECDQILEQYRDISLFTRILQIFNHKKIDKIIQTILVCLFKALERNRNNEQIDLPFYIKQINELFNSTFHVLNKEIRILSIREKNHKCSILSLYLDLLYKLIKNNEGICPDLTANLMGNSISPIYFFNIILNECDNVKPVLLTMKILMEIIHNHFKYFDINTSERILFFLVSSPSDIQFEAIKFFFTLIQTIANGNNQIDPNQLESLRIQISELDLYSKLISLFKADNLFFNSVDYAIQSLDILHDFLANDELLLNFDQEMIEHLCLLIKGNLEEDTLNSIINIFFKLFDFLTATNIEQRNFYVQALTNNFDQDAIDLVLESKKVELVHKAQIFFNQIQEIASSFSEQ